MRNTLVRNGSAVRLGTVFVTLCLMFVPLTSFHGSGMTPRDDTTPPVTTISFHGSLGDNGWYVSAVHVTLNASDAESGVNDTYYKINDGPWVLYANSFQVSNSGNYSIAFYSTDNAGNVEPQQTQPLKIDTAMPTINNFIHRSLNEMAFAEYAQDDISGMNRVEFYIGPYLQEVDTTPLYCWVFRGLPRNLYCNVTGIAYDNAGNAAFVSDGWGDLGHIEGFVRDVVVTNTSITFRSVLAWKGLLPLLPFKYTITNYDGFVHPHWIDIYYL